MDVERFVAERLMDITGIKTVLEVPDLRPDEFVSVERTGGPEMRFSDKPTLAVQSWAKTRRRASEMARSVNNALKGLMALDCVFEVDIEKTYRWPDPESGHERYQTVVTLAIYE